jgi:nicotinamide-nucleotide amidase
MLMNDFEEVIAGRIELLADTMQRKGWMLACAESCTGGLLAKSCTDLAGSSRWFDRAYITYSNKAKTEMLGVPSQLIREQGAVSEPVAMAMVEAVLKLASVAVAVSITGIAGPEGGTADKPVGTVCFGFAVRGQRFEVSTEQFSGTRQQVRQQSVLFVLDKLMKTIEQTG